jgi:PAS domain S-box-containing protein
MGKKTPIPAIFKNILIGTLVLGGLYATSLYNYILFHNIAEIFGIVIASGIFIIAWNSRHIVRNNYLLFIGIAYLFIGVMSLLHTLSYKGMQVFHGYGTNLPTQLWISARYMESISLLTAPLILGRRIRPGLVFLLFSTLTLLLLGSVFYWDIFPVCFIEGKGLTPFKKISEYVISLIFSASIFMLYRKKEEFDATVYRLLVAAISLNIISEFAFTFYVDVYGFSNLTGHLLKIISFYLIYKAIIENSLMKPYQSLFRDLKQNEEALLIKNYAIESSMNAIALSDNYANLTYVNSSFLKLWGYDNEKEVLGKPALKFWQDEKKTSSIVETLKNRGNWIGELVGRRKDNTFFDVQVSASMVKDKNSNPVCMLASFIDVTERKKVEEELKKHREHLMELVEERTYELRTSYEKLEREAIERRHAEEQARLMALFAELNPSPVLRFDTNSRILMANSAAIKIFDIELQSETFLTSLLPGLKEFNLTACIQNGTILSYSAQVDSRYFHFILTGVPDLKVGQIYGSDITEQKKAEAETLRTRHLASLGELAAGVAHEINNPINGIINYTQILANKTDPQSKEHDIAGRILKEGNRIAGIIKSLLSFARDSKEEKQHVSVHEIIADSLAISETQLKIDGIDLQVDLPPDLPVVIAQPQHIEQVFLNVISNARYALNQKYPGINKNKILKIFGKKIDIDGSPYVQISFHDKGTGIHEGILDNVMNPFFTTKPKNIGTGLGLSISHGIIDDHGGNITVKSIEGEFTELNITLPSYNGRLKK